jgi:hypothetical protein
LRFIIASVLVVISVTGCFAQSRNRRRPTAPPEPSIISIHQIDFKNYTLPLNGKSYKLIDGFYAETTAAQTQWGMAIVDGPYYGDLTGDKKEEAAFVLRYGPIGAPNAAEVRIYALQDGKPALLVTFLIATAINCELDHYISIEDGTVIVERIYGNGSQCDHNEVTQYRWNGNSFMPVGDVKRSRCRCM